MASDWSQKPQVIKCDFFFEKCKINISCFSSTEKKDVIRLVHFQQDKYYIFTSNKVYLITVINRRRTQSKRNNYNQELNQRSCCEPILTGTIKENIFLIFNKRQISQQTL